MLQLSELQYSKENDVEEISQLACLPLSDDEASSEKNSGGVPEKAGYPDPVYIMAANVFQGIRIEKSPEKVLIKYGNKPLRSLPKPEDESRQRSSYELAFSALKCE